MKLVKITLLMVGLVFLAGGCSLFSLPTSDGKNLYIIRTTSYVGGIQVSNIDKCNLDGSNCAAAK